MDNKKDYYRQLNNKSHLFTFLLAMIIIFFIITNFIWLSLDTLPPAWDQSHHMLLSLKYYRLISEAKSIGDIKNLFSISHYYPPFFHILTIPLIFFLGFSEDNLIFVNFFYLALFGASIFGIGKLLFNQRIGLLATLLALFYPIMYAMSREYLIDFALVAMVTAVQYLILKSEGGLKKPWDILLGLAIGFTLLTKPVSIIFFLPMWVFIFIRSFRHRRDFLSLFTVVIISLLIAIPWYFSAFHDLLILNRDWQHIAMMVERDPYKFIPSVLWYKNVSINALISPNLFFFFLLGLLLFLILDRRWKVFFALMAWMVPAFFVLVFTPNKDPRYIMPIFPVFALFTIGGIDAITKRPIRNIFYCIIIAIGYIQFNNLSFNVFPNLIREKRSYRNHAPLRQEWRNKEILEYISHCIGYKPIVIGILPNCQYFNPPQFILYANLLKLPYSIEEVGNSLVSFEQIKKYDILITKYPEIASHYLSFYREKFYKELNELGIEKLGFKELKEFDLPDKSKVVIYQKI